MNKPLHKFCIFGMPLLVACFTVGVLMAGLFPPPTPLRNATELANYLNGDTTIIRIGLIICAMGCGFAMPYAAAVSREVEKMTNGGLMPSIGRNMAADIQLIGVIIFGFSIFIPILLFMGTTFNPLIDPTATKLLYDTSFIFFVAPVSFGTAWMAFLGIAMLFDRQPIKTFPRWFAYYTLFTAFDFLGGGFCVLTKTGPFAWNGVISYYIPFTTWGLWSVGMTVFLLRSLEREYADPAIKPAARVGTAAVPAHALTA